MESFAPHFNSLQTAIDSLFPSSKIIHQCRISGGDINEAFSLTLSNNQKIFMKANAHAGLDFFEAEATGLSAIASCKKIGTPKILAVGNDDSNNFSFLLLEFINSSKPIKDYWRIFGHELASLHKSDSSQFSSGKKFGFFQDNFIGQTNQQNTPNNSWVDFFRDSRLVPQIKMASQYFDNSFHSKFDYLLNHLDKILIEPEYPSLLHGDLWRGNVYCGADGKAMLIDPASYAGFYEADLAMTELFGKFPIDFYDGYYEITPKISGYETRRIVYNLYQLLNHLNLFGESYLYAVYESVGNCVKKI